MIYHFRRDGSSYRSIGIRLMRKKNVCWMAFRGWLFPSPALIGEESACCLLLVHTLLRSATPQTCGHGDHMRACIICLHTLQGKITNVGADPYCHGSITLVCPVSMNEPARSLMANVQKRSDTDISGERGRRNQDDQNKCARGQTDKRARIRSLTRWCGLPVPSSDSDLGTHSSNPGTDACSPLASNPLAESHTHMHTEFHL